MHNRVKRYAKCVSRNEGVVRSSRIRRFTFIIRLRLFPQAVFFHKKAPGQNASGLFFIRQMK